MATRRWFLFLWTAATISATVACGGGSTANVKNPPPPQVTPVSIAYSPTPVASLKIAQPTNITAVVDNDSSSAGVDWTVTCQNSGNCGSLSSQHTSSGQANVYTPPSSFAGNTENVNVVAYATADHTKNVLATISVTAFGSSLSGAYVLQAQGIDATLGAYQFAGVIVLDGNGGIASGEQTVNVFDQSVGMLLSKSATVTGGTYFVGVDGRGLITINTSDPTVGASGTEKFSLVFLSSSQVLISQADSTATATGTMDLQTSPAPPTGGYAFAVSGTDVASMSPTAFGGVFNIDSPNTISGTGSASDQNLAGVVTANQPLSGTVSSPDAFGAVTIDLTIGFAAAPVQLVGYLVDGTNMKLIESDNQSGAGFGSTGGIAIGQGPNTGTFTTTAAFSGTYVFGIRGVDLSILFSSGVSVPETFTSVGVITAKGNGNLKSGFMDTFFQGSCVQASCTQNGILGSQISAVNSGTYTVAVTGSGHSHETLSTFSPAPNPAFRPQFYFYLTGGSSPVPFLYAGDFSAGHNYPSVGIGIAYPQSTSAPTFGGTYGFNLTQQNGSETDSTGEFTADPVAGTLSGLMDTSSGLLGEPLAGTFGSLGTNGSFSGGLSGLGFDFVSPSTSEFVTEFYAIDPAHGFFVETDLKDPLNPSGVVSLGYYSARTPVCAGCP